MEEEQRRIDSEALSQTREILNALRKQTKQLVDQTDLKTSLRSLATRINNVAQKSVALSSKNVTLLTDQKSIQKEISSSYLLQQRLIDEASAAKTNIDLLNQENLNLEKKISQELSIGNEEQALSLEIEKEANETTIKTLSRIGDATNALREEVRLYRREAIQAGQELKKIEEMPSVKLFDGLKEATKNIPFLSTFFDEAAERSREIARDIQRIENDLPSTAQQSLQDALENTDELTEDFIKALDRRTDIIKKAGLKDEDGKILVGKEAAEKIGSPKEIGSLFPKPNKFTEPLKEGFNDLVPILKRALGPLYLLKELLQGFLRADGELVEIQKSFAASRNEAMGIRQELSAAAAGSGNLNVTTTKLLATVTELSEQFGFVARFSDETLVTTTMLVKQVGLAADAAGALAAASVATGTSLEENYKNVLEASYELQQQKGVQFDLRKILEDTAKVTGQVRANLGTNPEAIAKAVTQAKLFGAEMDDIVSSSRSLLDFQSSIESELEAELLIGKDLNLERARSAALMGDMETVAKELTKQAGDYTDFSNMNVLQQDALAKSLGMQADQLADILFQQEVQNKSKKELIALGREDLADRLESQTLADKFNATVDKLKGIFADVGTAFFPILQLLGDALSIVNLIVAPITDLIQLLVAVPRALMGAEDAFSSINFSTDDAFGFGEGGVFADDAMIPPSHQGGKTLLGPEGSIKFNKDDTIVAGTDLFSEDTPTVEKKQSITDNVINTVNNEQNRLNEIVNRTSSITEMATPTQELPPLIGSTPLSQMPDYQQVMSQTGFGDVSNITNSYINNKEGDEGVTNTTSISPVELNTAPPVTPINQQVSTPIAPSETAGNTLIQELIAEQKITQQAIKEQTKILAQGQDTIAKTKTKLQVGATDFFTDVNVNSFRIQ